MTRDGWYRVRADGLGAHEGRYLQLVTRENAVPIRVTGDDWIEFYGQGLDTPTTDARIYWLTLAAQPGPSIPEVKVETRRQEGAPSFRATVERRDRMIYFPALLNGDEENIFGPVVSADQATQTLALKEIDATQGATLAVRLQGVTNVPHTVRVRWNGDDVGFAEVAGLNNQTATFNIAGSALRPDENTVTLQSVNGPTDVLLVDRVQLTYSHRCQADNNQLRFTLAAGQLSKLAVSILRRFVYLTSAIRCS